MNEKNITDMVEVKAKIERMEHHLKLLKEGQIHSDSIHSENGKKLDTLVNAVVDSPYNANNGIIKRVNSMEKIVENHVLFWRILIGSVTSGSVLWVFIKIIIK